MSDRTQVVLYRGFGGDGKVWVHFPTFAAGQREAARLRQAAAEHGQPPEAIAFDTGADQSLPER